MMRNINFLLVQTTIKTEEKKKSQRLYGRFLIKFQDSFLVKYDMRHVKHVRFLLSKPQKIKWESNNAGLSLRFPRHRFVFAVTSIYQQL